MTAAKIAITLDRKLLKRLDRLVEERRYPSRSRVIQEALEEKVQRMDKSRLAREAAKLNPDEQRAMADKGLAEDFKDWPEY
jgi:metal-responsive CopG/Arc/MetJ family transcriptional regulator